jgi:hypothetical protein
VVNVQFLGVNLLRLCGSANNVRRWFPNSGIRRERNRASHWNRKLWLKSENNPAWGKTFAILHQNDARKTGDG